MPAGTGPQKIGEIAGQPANLFEFNAGELQITNIVVGPNRKARLNFPGDTNLTYIVEASTNLVEWSDIGNASPDPNGLVFRDQEAPFIDTRFYRIRIQ